MLRSPGNLALAAVATAALVAAGCAAGPGAPANTERPPSTFEEAKALASRRGVPLLVDFYSPT